MYSPVFLFFFVVVVFFYFYFFFFFFFFFFLVFSNSQLSSSTNVAHIFKGAREYKQCKSSNRPDMIWTLFFLCYIYKCTSKKSSFLLFYESSDTIYSYFVLLLVKNEKCS